MPITLVIKPAAVPIVVATAAAPALTAVPIDEPAAIAPTAAGVNTTAAANATTPIPIAIPLRILPNNPECFFLKQKVYLRKNPSDI